MCLAHRINIMSQIDSLLRVWKSRPLQFTWYSHWLVFKRSHVWTRPKAPFNEKLYLRYVIFNFWTILHNLMYVSKIEMIFFIYLFSFATFLYNTYVTQFLTDTPHKPVTGAPLELWIFSRSKETMVKIVAIKNIS